MDTSNQSYIEVAKSLDIDQVKLDNQTYTIQKGDNLSQIAQDNNTTVDKLIVNNPWLTEENRISDDGSYALIKPGEKLNLTVDDKTTTFGIDEKNNIVPEYQEDLTTHEIIPLKEGQTISHIAQKTNFNSIDLLEYNGLSLEQAKSLTVGYKVLVSKEKPISIEGEYGTIKLFKNHDETFTAKFPDEQNNKTNITYSEDSDLLIYGDRTNPNKITFKVGKI